MIGAKVDVRTGWGAEFAREVNMQVRSAVAVASQHGADVASGAVTRRRTGRMGRIDAVEVRSTADGWEGGFRSEAFYSGFQSRGTLGNRKAKASTLARRSSPSGQQRFSRVAGSRGITPIRHEEKGLLEAKRRLVSLINQL